MKISRPIFSIISKSFGERRETVPPRARLLSSNSLATSAGLLTKMVTFT